MKKIAFFAAAFAAISTPALAAPGDTATATGSATAVVVAPIAITHDAGATLNFGTFTPGTAAGTVTVSQAGVASKGGDVVLMSGSTSMADGFTVTGGAGRGFGIVVGGTKEVVNGANKMTFTTDAPATGVLTAGGTYLFKVGGTLSVAAGQAAGTYNGTYSVTVTYN